MYCWCFSFYPSYPSHYAQDLPTGARHSRDLYLHIPVVLVVPAVVAPVALPVPAPLAVVAALAALAVVDPVAALPVVASSS